MDASSILTTLLSSKSITGISKATDTSSADVSNILAAAVPALLQGAQKQTSGKDAAGFTQALAEHAADSTSNITSFLKNVDLDDGSKILGHLLTASATKAIAKESKTSESTTKSVLSAVAPLFMSLLGQQTSGSSANAIGSLLGGLMGSSNLTSLLGGLLGATSTSTSSKPGSGKKPSGNSAVAGLAGSLLSGLLSGK
ncbi:MAG: DUF937 domain-containing protein [Treponema sp.]|nr:DUF937 domain-containing protein [Treponema sp.]